MATTPDFAEYITSQLENAGTVTARKMFGEYGLYLDDKLIGLICDHTLFLKAVLPDESLPLEPPYKGAKPYMMISEVDDAPYLCQLAKRVYENLPAPKPKKKKQPRQVSSKVLHFEAELKQNGDMNAAYVEVPYDIEQEFGLKRLLVHALIDGVPYDGQMVRMQTPCWILGINQKIRRQIGKTFGDSVEITFQERPKKAKTESEAGLSDRKSDS